MDLIQFQHPLISVLKNAYIHAMTDLDSSWSTLIDPDWSWSILTDPYTDSQGYYRSGPFLTDNWSWQSISIKKKFWTYQVVLFKFLIFLKYQVNWAIRIFNMGFSEKAFQLQPNLIHL